MTSARRMVVGRWETQKIVTPGHSLPDAVPQAILIPGVEGRRAVVEQGFRAVRRGREPLRCAVFGRPRPVSPRGPVWRRCSTHAPRSSPICAVSRTRERTPDLRRARTRRCLRSFPKTTVTPEARIRSARESRPIPGLDSAFAVDTGTILHGEQAGQHTKERRLSARDAPTTATMLPRSTENDTPSSAGAVFSRTRRLRAPARSRDRSVLLPWRGHTDRVRRAQHLFLAIHRHERLSCGDKEVGQVHHWLYEHVQ